MSTRKYESWGNFLKKNREGHFRSAREFCARVKIGISYPQYSRYEAGEQLPNLEQALQLCKLLDIPLLEGLLEWCRAQVSESNHREEVNSLIDQIHSKHANKATNVEAANDNQISSGSTVSLDDVIVFNRSHLNLFKSDPLYRDIFTYINSFAPEWIAAEEISLAIGVEPIKLEAMLEHLNDHGVILVAGGKCRAAKRNFYFPDDEDFYHLKNANFDHNSSSIIKNLKLNDLQERKAYRGLVTRELSVEQLEMLITKSEALMTEIISMPETNGVDKVFSLCVLLGQRFSRPKKNKAEAVRHIGSSNKQPDLVGP